MFTNSLNIASLVIQLSDRAAIKTAPKPNNGLVHKVLIFRLFSSNELTMLLSMESLLEQWSAYAVSNFGFLCDLMRKWASMGLRSLTLEFGLDPSIITSTCIKKSDPPLVKSSRLIAHQEGLVMINFLDIPLHGHGFLRGRSLMRWDILTILIARPILATD